jgi:alkane 1-monooxygenase
VAAMRRSSTSTIFGRPPLRSVLATQRLSAQNQPLCSAGNGRSPYWWLLGMTVPGLVFGSWLGVLVTGAGVFWWSGPIVVLGIVPVLDYVVGADASNPATAVLHQLEDNWFHRVALLMYLPNQYLSLAFACWLWAGGGWLTMSTADKLGLMVTVGFVAGIAINAAHELGHRRARIEAWLAKIALAQSCYGHFYVDHDRGHHVAVATAEDPASSRMGQSVYTFIPTSAVGSLRRAWTNEATRLHQQGRPRFHCRNELLNAWAISVALLVGLSVWFGPEVLPWLLGQAIMGICLLESVSYLEHYGLRRQRRPDGSYEPVQPGHSWNSNSLIANLFLFHAQRHSDHHLNPQRRYQTLHHLDEAPQLPAGYGTMLLRAYLPPLWRRIMDHRVIDHYNGQAHLAALTPRRRHQLTLLQP